MREQRMRSGVEKKERGKEGIKLYDEGNATHIFIAEELIEYA